MSGTCRRRLRRIAGGSRSQADLPAEPRWLAQVHGIRVADLDAGTATAAADGAHTRQPGRVCAILTADCLPVLFAAESGEAVAAAHAGWRGLAGGVIEATVRALAVDPPKLCWSGWVPPSVLDILRSAPKSATSCCAAIAGAQCGFHPNARGRFMADLAALARRRLARLGIERIYGGGECTYSYPDRYFSHRRDGQTGRQATLIWLQGTPQTVELLGRIPT